jgi:hypothetical protein
MSALAGDAVGAVQESQPGEAAGPQPRFLGEFQPGQVLRAAGLPVRETALRE